MKIKVMKHKVEFEIDFKRHTFPGKFIVFEGIDGSGKTTQVEKLKEVLVAGGSKVWLTNNPSNHMIGQFIRNEILSGKEKIPPQAIQYLFNADRVVQQDEIVSKLKEGYVVISDRYFWSSVAYGMADLDNTSDFLLTAYSILSFYHQFILPDLTLFLKVDPMEAMSRINKEKQNKEIYEEETIINNVSNIYGNIIERFPSELTVIDANRSIDQVNEEISTKVKELLKTA